jgi:predicted dehydrogenase
MRNPISMALVGAGGIAQSYAQCFRGLDEARLVAVADLRVDAAQALAEDLGATAFADHEDLLRKTACDAVIVCTPPVSHTEVCLHFLEREIPVLCEKPLAIRRADAQRLLAAATRHDVQFTMASKFRYVDDVIRARSLVASGIVGEPILLENTFTARVDMTQRWNANPAISGGGVLIDNGTHSVDLARYFLGPITEVHAVEGKRIQALPVEDTAQLFLRSADGAMASIDLSWSLHKETQSFLEIHGSQGSVRVGWRQSAYRQHSSPDWVGFGSGYDKVAAFRSQIRNFVRALRGEEPLRITAADALASVEVIEAAYASLAASRWTPVPLAPGTAAGS